MFDIEDDCDIGTIYASESIRIESGKSVEDWLFVVYMVLGYGRKSDRTSSFSRKKDGNLVLLLFLCIFAENFNVNKRWY